ncbi:hypothetical protein [Roseateles amylovorans]|jgi:hypothetical protein|uniref:Uncharacterized protein n=1 Tax=Roseateles amylovorans TaxID=2978473 RepID=A0ABY6AVH9_9BURK|nr:hypothetical protein [Roseateles amylovorans]UXH76389.1 hypothetical protein N4261_15115 [Roseateles amylovorans]
MNLLSTILNLAARILLAVASLVLFFVMLLVGLAVLAGVLVWSLLRGRKPVLHTATFKRATHMGAHAWGRRPPPGGRMTDSAEVVDVEVREVPHNDPRLER